MTHADVGVRQVSAAGSDLGADAGLGLGRPLSRAPVDGGCGRPREGRRRREALQRRYEGKLAALGKDGAALGEAIAAYEALSDTMGKLGSYAGLLYAADTRQPRASPSSTATSRSS